MLYFTQISPCSRRLTSDNSSVTNVSLFISSVAVMDEEDMEEDFDEEDLDIGNEIDPDSPPWDIYGEPDIDEIDDSTEDTALLQTRAVRTEIIVTPISPVMNEHPF